MAIAVSIDRTQTYVLEQDRELPEHDQTVFELRTLTARAKTKILDTTTFGRDEDGLGEAMPLLGQSALIACSYGIAGWTNLRTADGTVVEPKFIGGGGRDRRLSDESMDAIAPFLLELSGAVTSMNNLDEEDEGKSEGSPASPAVSKVVGEGEMGTGSSESSSPSSSPATAEGLPLNPAAVHVPTAVALAQ